MELADVVRRFGSDYVRKFGESMLPSHRRTLNDILTCRTAAQGGRMAKCDHCPNKEFRYHSCCNRHCPKCGGKLTEVWLEGRRLELLPIPYFHVVFTVPQELRLFLRSNQKVGYGLLFKTSASALRQLAAQPRFLGADVGMMSVLHTWGRNLSHHPHVHCLVTGGGLTPEGTWVGAKPKFLVPHALLSKTYREEFKKCFEKAFPDATLPPIVWRKKWVVDIRKAPNGTEAVLEYLGRYINRVAFSNSSLRDMDEETVTFAYKDTASGQKRRMTLDGAEFLRRFLQHVLPKGFRKVRYYGAWNPYHREAFRLIQLQLFFLAGIQPPVAEPPADLVHPMCPSCRKGHLIPFGIIPRMPRAP